jgi:hypothetical protein
MKKNIFRLTTKLAAVTHRPSSSLSDIFVSGTEKLRPEVSAGIRNGISKISSYLKENHPGVEIKHYELIGAAVTHQYGPTSDIDTTVFINLSDEGKTSGQFKQINAWIGEHVDGEKFGERPFQFKIMPVSKRGKNDHADAVYDPVNEDFIKRQNYEAATEAYQSIIESPDSPDREAYKNLEIKLQGYIKSWANLGRSALNAFASGGMHRGYETWLRQRYNLILKSVDALKGRRRESYRAGVTQGGRTSLNWNSANTIFKMLSDEEYIDVFDLAKKALYNNSRKIDWEKLFESVTLAERIKDQTIGYSAGLPPKPKEDAGQQETEEWYRTHRRYTTPRKPLPTAPN